MKAAWSGAVRPSRSKATLASVALCVAVALAAVMTIRYVRGTGGGSSVTMNMPSSGAKTANAPVVATPATRQHFKVLSAAGTDVCADMGNKPAIDRSMAMLSTGARLQGACCSAMSFDHYVTQTAALRRYAGVPEIPGDTAGE